MASNTSPTVTIDDKVFTPLELEMIADGHDLPADLLQACLAQASLTPACVRMPALKVSCRQRMAALTACCLAHDDPWFALRLGQRLHLTAYGMAGFSLLSSPSLAEAIDTANEFSVLMNLDHRLELTLCNQTAELRLRENVTLLGSQKRFGTLLEVGKVLRLLNDILAIDFKVDHIDLSLRGTREDERILAQITGATVALNRPCTLIRFAASHAVRPLPQSHPLTHQACRAVSDEQMQEVRRRYDVCYQVQKILLATSDRIPALPDVASALNISARTLRRRLEAEQSTYNQILEDVRTQLAVRYLLDSSLSTEVISEKLSYSDAANFRHAFKRWTGITPKAFRAQHRTHDDLSPAPGTHTTAWMPPLTAPRSDPASAARYASGARYAR